MHGITTVKSIIGTREACPSTKSGRWRSWGEYSNWEWKWSRGCWTGNGWDGFRTGYYDGTNDGCGGTNAATASSTAAAATAATTTNDVWTTAATTTTITASI